jgi:hypothetical protein
MVTHLATNLYNMNLLYSINWFGLLFHLHNLVELSYYDRKSFKEKVICSVIKFVSSINLFWKDDQKWLESLSKY